jgi:hypothetical protein
MIDLANMGLFIIAERGRGKGAILETVKALRHRYVMEVGRLTPAGIRKVAEKLNDSEVTMINPDITNLYTPYLKDAAVNVLSSLLYDHKMPESWTDRYNYKVENCYLSFLSGVQPKIMRDLNMLGSWESMYKDRFIRFPLFYPLGTPDYIKQYPEVGTISLPETKPNSVTIPQSILHSKEYMRLKVIIERQTSEGRSGAYTDSLLKAHAFLNERDIVTNEDLEVFGLFTLNLMADYWLSERITPAGSLKFEPDSYVLLFRLVEHKILARKQLQKMFKVSQRTLVKYMRPLIERNIIVGVYGTPEYKMNKEWYEQYVQPIIKWHEKIGVETT